MNGGCLLFNYYPTISEAATYSEIPIPKWLDWIQQGLIPANPTMPDMSSADVTGVVRIPLFALPNLGALRYIQDHLLKESFFSIDLISAHNAGRLSSILEDINLVKTAALIRNTYTTDATSHLVQFVKSHGIHISTLYRKEALIMKSDLHKLIAPVSCRHSKRLCELSKDYLAFHHLRPNHPSQNKLLAKLQSEATLRGKGICRRCPYKKSCQHEKNGMVCTTGRWAVNRFLATISEQDTTFVRKGRVNWEAGFAHKTKRDKPEFVNAVWFGDHHVTDVVIIVGLDANKKPVLARPWLTVVTDAASDAIVGSIVSLRPNSDTIAECFCRAAALTIDSPFYALPEVFYVDRGRDYRSKLIEGTDPETRVRLETHEYLNRAFCDNPLLPALNVTVKHALPRTGRSKTIERTFGTVTCTWFSQIPGWLGNKPENRPYDFAKELKRHITLPVM